MNGLVYEIFVNEVKTAVVPEKELKDGAPDWNGEVDNGDTVDFFGQKMRVIEKTIRFDENVIELHLENLV